nr:glycosyltransferase [Helleborus thibetanus]
MGSEDQKLHIFFFPFMAHGHRIPMIDIVRLFAARGTKCTIISTPLNALHFAESIDRDKQSGLDIGILTIPFPAVQAGLPEGCEDQGSIPAPEMIVNFLEAVGMLLEPFNKLLQEHHPDCVVADAFLPWTTEVADRYGIPRLVFHGKCYFPLCVAENIKRFAPHEKLTSDSETFIVPGLPDQIEMTKSELHKGDTNAKFADRHAIAQEAEERSYGVLANSFYEMEPAYVEYFKKEMGRRAWSIGPVSLYNKTITSKAQRGEKSVNDEQLYLNWLDSREPGSVLYVCFGSISHLGTAQVREIAMGLEASKIPFVWVVRMTNIEKEDFLPEGFEDRMEGKGLIIKGWAPQVLILDHPAVGGFMTHCGWNSTCEGISAGLPMITWPMFADQFYNEKLVTQVLKIGIAAGNKTWKWWMEADTVFVTKERVNQVVAQLMGSGTEADDMRRRARELGNMAKKAVEEGGSSYNDLTNLIQELRLHKQKSNNSKN